MTQSLLLETSKDIGTFTGDMEDAQRQATFPGSYDSLTGIAEFFRCATQEAGFDDAAAYQIELAIDEAATNIIEHAYGGEGRGEIECAYQVTEKGLTIFLKDHGLPFDPDLVNSPDILATIEKRNNHGYGIYLIRKLMDEVSFEFSKRKGNLLILVKYKVQGT